MSTFRRPFILDSLSSRQYDFVRTQAKEGKHEVFATHLIVAILGRLRSMDAKGMVLRPAYTTQKNRCDFFGFGCFVPMMPRAPASLRRSSDINLSKN
jgi:hypothetical protein